MCRIREVLRLKHECTLPNAQIAAALGIAKGSVANYLAAATAAELTHTEALTLDDAALSARLHPQRYLYPQFAIPDFSDIGTTQIETDSATPTRPNVESATFIPIAVEQSAAAMAAATAITIELRRGATVVKVGWPLVAAADCATWLRELLR